MKLAGLDHVALSVRDVERSAAWYAEVFGFRNLYPGKWNGIPVFMGNEQMAIALFPTRDAGTQEPGRRRGILDFAFRTSGEELRKAQSELTDRGIAFAFQDHEISHSIYLRDPDGHEVEITSYDLTR
ncbi:MAG: VOC family protein [Verrucomicrobiota bacterium]